ncbi:exonuclease subunit SbcD [Ferrimonas pelagia]|uniref:Nuclease SbcCD subunit D n=1 Tax=Ferrimonas pelagia TaxID=1177826 RepID=A0ABP9ECM4_9GAMM
MRILHTSDWHLGQYFYGKSRAAEHQAFLDWLLAQIDQLDIDALIVAGDLFDTGTPPSYARSLYNAFVVQIQRRRCKLILLGGNHDSVAMLNESKQLLACLGTDMVAAASEAPAQQVVTVTNAEQQPIGLVCAIPYLRPRDIVRSEANQSAQDKQRSLQQQIERHYREVYDAALAQRDALNQPGLPIIATGHLTTVGASSSESVRDLYIGTLDAFPASAFPPADYIALGHIHRPQKIGGSDTIRYCGSPIPLSFDELGRDKEVLLIEFAEAPTPSVSALNVPLSQPMAMLKGDLASIEQQLAQFEGETDTTWLDIEVVAEDYLSDLQARIIALTEALPVEVLLVRRARNRRNDSIEQQDKETLAELTVQDVFARRLASEVFDGDAAEQRKQRLQARFDQTLALLAEAESEPDDPAQAMTASESVKPEAQS